jgi:alpha-tubulin suppressor-like RCC1 family protein
VVGWGIDDTGQTNVPSGLAGVTALAGSQEYCLALETNGTVASWGAPPTLPAGLSNVVAVAAGLYHTLALMSNSTVLAWGSDQSGEGIVPTGLTNVTAIAAGWSYSLALAGTTIVLIPVTLTNPTWSSNNFSVTIQSQNGFSYTLQYTTNLAPDHWTVAQSNNGTGGILTLTDTSAGDPQRFYRVLSQ